MQVVKRRSRDQAPGSTSEMCFAFCPDVHRLKPVLDTAFQMLECCGDGYADPLMACSAPEKCARQ